MSTPQAVVTLLVELLGLLSRDPLVVADICARVGPALHDPGGLMPIELRPALPGVRAARLARYPDSGLPYLLELALEPDARPTPAALEPWFGAWQPALTDRGRPRELLFYPAAGAAHWRVVLIAQLAPGIDDLASAPITAVAFRRDAATSTP